MSIKTDVFKNAYMELGDSERREILRWIYEFESTPLKERIPLKNKSIGRDKRIILKEH